MGLRSELPDLLGALSGTSSIERVGSAVLPRIEQAIHSTRIALVIEARLVSICGLTRSAGQRWLRRRRMPATIELFDQDDDQDFPIRMALRSPFGAVSGWLLLGPRPDRSLYGKDDLEALAAIAPSLQRTIFSVVEREREQHETRASLQRLAAKVIELEAAVGSQPNRPNSA